MRRVFTSRSAEETMNYGRAFACALHGEDVVLLLFGDLGAGKTTFVRGLVDELGSRSMVSSPSFNILNIYQSTRYSVYHIDAYRDSHTSWEALMMDDIVRSPFCCLIEWPENFHGLPDVKTISLRFEALQGGRSLIFSSKDQDFLQNVIQSMEDRLLMGFSS